MNKAPRSEKQAEKLGRNPFHKKNTLNEPKSAPKNRKVEPALRPKKASCAVRALKWAWIDVPAQSQLTWLKLRLLASAIFSD